MATVVIPGECIRSESDLHRWLAKELDFGPYYGRNLNALWDRLTTDVERPVRIIWTNAAISRAQLGQELFDRIVGLLLWIEARDIEADYADCLTVELHD